MRFERTPEQIAEKHEIDEEIIKHEETLKEYLKEEAEKLRESGFGVDNECRIKMNEFKDLFGKESVEKDQKTVEIIESHFENTQKKKKGEILEGTITLALNQLLFDKKLIAIRTAKYDDYHKERGIDHLIFDKETKMLLGVIDTATSWKDKVNEVDKDSGKKKLLEKIKNGGYVKYGFRMSEAGPEKATNQTLSLFIISLNNDELLALIQNIEKEELSFEGRQAENRVLEELQKQSKTFAKISSPKLKSSYEKAGKIFEKL